MLLCTILDALGFRCVSGSMWDPDGVRKSSFRGPKPHKRLQNGVLERVEKNSINARKQGPIFGLLWGATTSKFVLACRRHTYFAITGLSRNYHANNVNISRTLTKMKQHINLRDSLSETL